MNKPTEKQIDEEIAKLKTMKPTVLRQSMFGDDHHEAIDAQIEVLTERMSEDEIYDKYPSVEENEFDGVADNISSSAHEAAMWMEGYDEDGSPSEQWQSLVRK